MILRQKAKNYSLDQIRNLPNTLRAYKKMHGLVSFAQPDVDDDYKNKRYAHRHSTRATFQILPPINFDQTRDSRRLAATVQSQ